MRGEPFIDLLVHVGEDSAARLRRDVGIAGGELGWPLGGPGSDNRRALALTTSLRNVGVGLVIVTSNFGGTAAMTAVLAYGIGASHQTGWTGLVAKLIQFFGVLDSQNALDVGKRAGFELKPGGVSREFSADRTNECRVSRRCRFKA